MVGRSVLWMLVLSVLSGCVFVTKLDGLAGDGGTPTCANLLIDAKNCGKCGHDCLGGECSAGACKPFRLALASQPTDLAVSTGGVAWTNAGDGSVVVVKKGATDPVALALKQSTPRGIAAEGDLVAWANETGGDVVTVSLSSSVVAPIASKQGAPSAVAITSSVVSWANADGALRRFVPQPPPGSVADVASALGELRAIASAGAGFVVVDTSGGRVVYVEGAKIVELAKGIGSPQRVAVRGDTAYVTARSENAIYAIKIDGSQSTKIATGQFQPLGIAVDADYVYWVTNTKGGSLVRQPIAGGTPQPLVTDLDLPYGVAVDDTAVLVTVYGGGTVLRLAK